MSKSTLASTRLVSNGAARIYRLLILASAIALGSADCQAKEPQPVVKADSVINSFAVTAPKTSPGGRLEKQAALIAALPRLIGNGKQLPNTFIGTAPGTAFYVAVVIKGTTVIGYVCDNSVRSAWLGGSITNGKIKLGNANGTLLDGTLTAGQIVGKIKVRGIVSNFRALPRTAKRLGGLYRERITHGVLESTGGWIIHEDGSSRGLLGKLKNRFNPPPVPNPGGGGTPPNPDCDRAYIDNELSIRTGEARKRFVDLMVSVGCL